MATVEAGLATQIKNIEAEYKKPMSHWVTLIQKSGLAKHGEIVALLKTKHGLAHGAANRVALVARAQLDGSDGDKPDLFGGKKAALAPIAQAILKAVAKLGAFEEAPKSGYVSLRAKKQFAMLKPAAKHVDLGLILPESTATTARLEASGSFNALFTHRVRVATVAEVDAELKSWLAAAYQRAS